MLKSCGEKTLPNSVSQCKADAIDKLVSFRSFPLEQAITWYNEFFQEEKQDESCPIIVIGDGGVGKTAIVIQVCIFFSNNLIVKKIQKKKFC